VTTAQGVRLPGTDHERTPERVVHARGAAAHGVFESYGTGRSVTKAALAGEEQQTEVFYRFSIVLGSRGSADTVLPPALSQIVTTPGSIAGRKIGIIAEAGADLAGHQQSPEGRSQTRRIRPRDRPRRRCPGQRRSRRDSRPDAADRPFRRVRPLVVAGVVTSDTLVKSFTDELAAAVGMHRAWDRALDVVASAILPVHTS